MLSVCDEEEGGEEQTNRGQSIYFVFFTCSSSLDYFLFFYVFQLPYSKSFL